MIRIERLIWNEDNVAHIAHHDVTPEEVESVCQGDFKVFKGHSGRIAIVGPGAKGRILFIVVAPKGEGAYLPITARIADRKEKQLYTITKGGGTNGNQKK